MAKRLSLLPFVLLLVLGISVPADAQRRSAPDAQVIAQATPVASGDRVEIYQHGVPVAPAFLKAAEEAYRRLEALTGRTLDTATLGSKIRIYVSDAVTVSHVWNGYGHPKDPKGSHTLREGLADYLALEVHPGAGVGPNAEGYDASMKIPADVIECLGTTKPPPAWLMTDVGRRRAYTSPATAS